MTKAASVKQGGKNSPPVPRPGVVVFTGHMMDRPDRIPPRLPVTLELRATQAIAAALKRLHARVGIASGACGGDLLFHEEILARGGACHVVLPCPEAEFTAACLQGFQERRGHEWEARFQRVWAEATSRMVLSQQCANDNAVASECCNRVILGLGKILAERIGGDLTVLALWDGQPGDAVGGTHSMVEYSRAKGIKVVTLNPLKPREKTLSSSTAQSVQAGSHRPLPGAEADPPQQIGYLLFADAVKFSKVTERQLPLLLERYLSRIAQLLRQYEHAVAATNTWGDGLYVVFSSPREAGLFALDLRDFVASGQWRQAGLPATFKLRVALHAGPVYRFHDPILGRANFIGSHVNFAARMEPATPPGQIYCSQAFAALAVAEGVREFQWEYVGEVELAKGAGAAAAYLLQRAKAGESPSHEQPA